jgi:hypothetical protein
VGGGGGDGDQAIGSEEAGPFENSEAEVAAGSRIGQETEDHRAVEAEGDPPISFQSLRARVEAQRRDWAERLPSAEGEDF